MDIRKITLSGVLLAAGMIVHQLMPPVFGVTPDVQLAALFIVILINGTLKASIAAGIVSGIITALTTKLPGAQIPNFLDKVLTCVIIYFAIELLIKMANSLNNKLKNKNNALSKLILPFANVTGAMAVIGLFGTLFSGVVFLTALLVIVGLPAGFSFKLLFLTSVLPAAVLNIFFTPLLYKVVERASHAAKR